VGFDQVKKVKNNLFREAEWSTKEQRIVATKIETPAVDPLPSRETFLGGGHRKREGKNKRYGRRVTARLGPKRKKKRGGGKCYSFSTNGTYHLRTRAKKGKNMWHTR